jgi:hypothetical protein
MTPKVGFERWYSFMEMRSNSRQRESLKENLCNADTFLKSEEEFPK